MNYRIAVDTGGTFTDVVVADRDGHLLYNKALTTPDRMYSGASVALRLIAEEAGTSLERLLADTSLFVYATTRATNAVVEHKTAATAFFTTEGFPDVLWLREGGKLEPFNFRIPYPAPYVPRGLTFEIPGRIDAQGKEVTPLNEDAVRNAVRQARTAGAEAVAVCLIWSIANPAHELRVRELVEEEWPEVPVTISHELNPAIREYRRASSTCIDASLKPLMQQHLREITTDLAEATFRGEFVVVTSFGGCLHGTEVTQRPIYTVGSGPAMAPVGAKTYASREVDTADVIVCDAGGTTFDVSLIEGGQVKQTRETWLGPKGLGDITGLSSVDVTSIGAGGGSIAWVDSGGLLRVGPHSAGAVPGPACYGNEGHEPTVTDAAAVLGYVDPGFFLGGRMALDLDAAERVIQEKVAEPTGLELERAAWAILAVANETMVSAIREITINQGVDPRECVLVAGGGAGGLNAAVLAGELGCPQVLIPRAAATLSALGAQFADVVAEASVSRYANSAQFDAELTQRTIAELDDTVDDFARRLPANLAGKAQRSYFIEARYPFQVWDLEVPLEPDGIPDEAALDRLTDRFHQEHERNFAVSEPGQAIEWQAWKARLTVPLDPPRLTRPEQSTDAGMPSPSYRMCYFDGHGTVRTPCYRGGTVPANTLIDGPAIFQESTTTVVVPPRMTARTTELGSYLIDTGGAHE